MKSSRRPRRFSIDLLEPRVVLSSATVPAAQVASGFPLSETATLKLGKPVEDLITTTFPDGSTQSATRLIVPNPANGTSTTYITTNLAGGGVQSSIDTSTTHGTITTQNYSATDSTGAKSYESVTDIRAGNTVKFRALILTPTGSSLYINGTQVQRGSTTITDEDIIDSAGKITHSHVVDTIEAPNLHSTTSQITPSLGAITTTTSTSTYNRLQPPGS